MTRTFQEIDADARDGSPFSNGTMGDLWMSQWCENCLNDSPEMVDRGEGCPLILVALLGKTPVEWFEQDGTQDYHCVEFRDQDGPGDTEPKPIPDPPDMEAMLPRETYTGALMFTANTAAPIHADAMSAPVREGQK